MLILSILWSQIAAPPVPDPATTHSLLEYSGVASIIAGGISMFGIHVFKPWLTEYYADRKHRREMEALGVANELAHANERIRHLERQDTLRQEQVSSLQKEADHTREEALRAKREAENAKAEALAAKIEAEKAKQEAEKLKAEVASNKGRLEAVEAVQNDVTKSGENILLPLSPATPQARPTESVS